MEEELQWKKSVPDREVKGVVATCAAEVIESTYGHSKSAAENKEPIMREDQQKAAINDVKNKLSERLAQDEDSNRHVPNDEGRMAGVETVRRTGSDQQFEVYVCKYNYDPVSYSPNENPDSELALTAGDYLFIYGDMDEDGFYEGELMNGKRGLVPSNFVEKVSDEELCELRGAIQFSGDKEHGLDEHSELERDNLIENIKDFSFPLTTAILEQTCPPVNMNDSNMHYAETTTQAEEFETEAKPEAVESKDLCVIESNESRSEVAISQLQDTDTNAVPGPKNLRVERQLHNSYFIAWTPPDGIHPEDILMYSVYCDGQFMASVKSTERTKALLEGIDSAKSHQIHVRTIAKQGQSLERQSIINIGRDGRLLPAGLRVSDVTTTSAVVSWTPASYAVEHTVIVDDTNHATIAPGACKCLITGLPVYSHHTVTISSNTQPTNENDELSASIAFCTLLKDLPAAPLEVQVDVGPKKGTLLVTWLPVPGVNNRDGILSDIVTGYTVYIDGTKVKELSSPTDDHVILGCESLSTANDPRRITVRTTTAYRESHDSQPAAVSAHLQQELGTKREPDKLKIGDSGFSAQLLSPVEGRCHLTDDDNGLILKKKDTNGHLTAKSANRNHQGVPQIEITRDSLSELIAADQFVDNDPMHDQVLGHSSGVNKPRKTGTVAMHQKVVGGSRKDVVVSRKKRDYFDKVQSSDAPTVLPGDRQASFHRLKGKDADYIGSDNDGVESVISELDCNDKQVRIFVAIYDYNPVTMSPNPDAASEELPFTEGQLLKVIGDKDSDGFYLAETNGRRGLVPCNMVSEVQVDDPLLAEQLLKESQKHSKSKHARAAAAGGNGATANRANYPRPRTGAKGRDTTVANRAAAPWCNIASARKMIAMYDYNPLELSPNVDSEMELPFRANDIVTVYGEVDYDGFYHGEINGIFGLVPSNFLKPFSAAQPGMTAAAGESDRTPRAAPRSHIAPAKHTTHRGRSPQRRDQSPTRPTHSQPPPTYTSVQRDNRPRSPRQGQPEVYEHRPRSPIPRQSHQAGYENRPRSPRGGQPVGYENRPRSPRGGQPVGYENRPRSPRGGQPVGYENRPRSPNPLQGQPEGFERTKERNQKGQNAESADQSRGTQPRRQGESRVPHGAAAREVSRSEDMRTSRNTQPIMESTKYEQREYNTVGDRGNMLGNLGSRRM